MLKQLKKYIDKLNKIMYEQNKNINKETRNKKRKIISGTEIYNNK